MKLILFDVDETLQGFDGPIPILSLVELRKKGHVVGICGNWGGFCRVVPDWHNIISLIVNLGIPKDYGMAHYKEQVPGFDEYILVGNIQGVSGASDDQGSAMRAGYRFVKESDFVLADLL